jgi:hypothetical protein
MKMRSQSFLPLVLGCFVFVGAMGEHAGANDRTVESPAPVNSGVTEGKVVEVESHTLVVESLDGKVVRIPMPGKTEESSSEFSKGDYIEATVTPQGITTSVRIVPNPEKHPEINPTLR